MKVLHNGIPVNIKTLKDLQLYLFKLDRPLIIQEGLEPDCNLELFDIEEICQRRENFNR